MKLLFVAMQRNGMTITSSKLQKEKYKPQKKKKQQKKGQIARYYSLSIKDTISFIYRKGKLCDNMLQPLYYGIEKQKEKSFIPYRLGFKYYISRFLLMGLKKNIFKTFPNIFFVFRCIIKVGKSFQRRSIPAARWQHILFKTMQSTILEKKKHF